MRDYELAVLLHPDLEIDQEKALSKIDKMIAELEGKVKARDDWGKRKLAYPVNKQSYGLYFFYIVSLKPTSVVELERYLKLSNEVLRFLVVKYEPPTESKPDKPAKTKSTEKTENKSRSSALAEADKKTANNKEDK